MFSKNALTLNLSTQIPKTADCVIIGGIPGAATAFYAARAGLKCVVLEKRPALCTLTHFFNKWSVLPPEKLNGKVTREVV